MITITVEERGFAESVIGSCKICTVAMIDTEGLPYLIPMNFGFEDDVIYLHSAPEGNSIKALNQNPNVCINFCSETGIKYQHEEVACSYRAKGSSVMCKGKVVFEDDFEEKVKALNAIMKQYTKRQFTYSRPAVENVKIWKVEIESISTKIFGAPNPRSRNYKDQDFSQFY